MRTSRFWSMLIVSLMNFFEKKFCLICLCTLLIAINVFRARICLRWLFELCLWNLLKQKVTAFYNIMIKVHENKYFWRLAKDIFLIKTYNWPGCDFRLSQEYGNNFKTNLSVDVKRITAVMLGKKCNNKVSYIYIIWAYSSNKNKMTRILHGLYPKAIMDSSWQR